MLSKAEQVIWLDHGSVLPLLTAGAKGAFVWSLGAEGRRRLPTCVRFTDDMGLRWSITADLHLEKLRSRDW